MSLQKFTEILINSNDFISGEKIAEMLGVSRNCIWKYVKELKKRGYHIESVSNKGYKLIDSGNNFSAEMIRKFLDYPAEIICYNSVTSTNDVLKDYAKNNPDADKTIIIADRQTKGKGRMGKNFSSPPSTGLYMSILLRPEFKASQAYMITAAAAVSVCRAIEKADIKSNPKIKWVNDVFCYGKKVCGILTEGAADLEGDTLEYAVLGIGINLFTNENDFPEEIRDIAGSLFKNKLSENFRNQFAASVIKEFFNIYDKNDFSFMDEYKKRSFLIGKRIISQIGEGIVEGISDRAELILKKDDGQKVVLSAGEISIKEIL